MKPMNQASFSSLVVPVLPAIGPLQHLQLLRRAALDDAFHDVDGLIGRHRIDDLLAIVDEFRLILSLSTLSLRNWSQLALVMAPNGAAVAILDTIDQRGLHLLAAVGDDCVGIDHA